MTGQNEQSGDEPFDMDAMLASVASAFGVPEDMLRAGVHAVEHGEPLPGSDPEWPYRDLSLRCRNCPLCGSPAVMLVGGNMHPQAFCQDDDCAVFMYDPSKSALETLRDAGQLVEHQTEHGTVYRVPEVDVEYGVRGPSGRVWLAEDATGEREWAEGFARATGMTLVRRTRHDGSVWHAVQEED